MQPSESISVRPVCHDDHGQWLVLWHGYNAFYGRSGATALDPKITAATWGRFFNPIEPVFALVAEMQGSVIGLAHSLTQRVPTLVHDSFALSES